jgi:hypothetical protein
MSGTQSQFSLTRATHKMNRGASRKRFLVRIHINNATTRLRFRTACAARLLLLPLLLTLPSRSLALSVVVHIRDSAIASASRGDSPPGLNSGRERGCGLRLAESLPDPDKVLEDLTVGATMNFKMWADDETEPGPFVEAVQVGVLRRPRNSQLRSED